MSNITSQLSVKLSLQGAEQVRAGMKQAEGGVVSFAAAADEARKTMLSLTGSLAGAVSVQQFFQAADAVTTLNNQLKLATGSTQTAGQAYETLFKIAQDSRVSFTELGSTFASVSRAGQELGISQQRLLTVTESIGNAMTISGGSAASMQAALVQLGQGIASGTLRGEELNSVMEQTPRLAKALADGLGVPIGKLREMGAAGQITSEQVISALEGQAAVLRGEVAGSTLTVAQAFTQLQNASIKAVGEFDKVTGASATLATAIGTLSSSVSTVGQAFKDNESAITTTLGVLAGASVGVALARTAAGLGGVATGIGGVAGAVTVLRGVVSALNPATLALLGIGAAVGGFVAYNAAQAKTADGIRRTIKELEALNKTGPGIYNRDAAGIASYNKSVDERTAKIRELRGQLAQMDAQNLDTKAEDARLLRHVASAKSVAAEGAAYDDLRTRLSAFKGDYAKYQADLKAIQEGMAKGEANGGLSEKEGIAMLTELAKKHGEVAKAATGRAKEEAKVGESAALYAKAMGMLMDNTVDAAAATNGYTRTQKDLLTVFSSPGFASMPDVWKQTIAEQAEAIIATEQLTEAEKTLATARAGSLKLSEAAEEAQAASADQLADRLASMRDEIALIGLTAQQVAELTAAKAEQVIADKEIELIMLRNADASAAQISALEREINLRRQLAGAMREKTVKEAAAESADQAQKEWKKASEQIEQSLTDALMRGFEGGKGFAENLRDTVENMFKTLVLRPIVSAVVSPMAGAITAGLGLPGAASAQGGNMLGSMVNNYASGAIGASLWGSSAAYGAALGTTSIGAGSQAAMLAAQTGAFGSAGTAATAAAAGNAGMSAVMTAAPYLGAALAVAAIISSMDDSGTMHTGGLGSYSAARGASVGDAVKSQGLMFDLSSTDYSASTAQASVGMAKTVAGMLDSTAATFGQKAGYFAATAWADDTSDDGGWGALMVKLGDQVLLDWKNGTDKWPGREFSDGEAGAKEYAAAVATDVRNYLLTQTPAWADTMLTALGDAPSLEQLAATVGQINSVATAIANMGRASAAFANLTDNATTALITALGGGEAAVASLGSYYTAYYSQTERTALATAQLTEQLATLGVALPTTREAYRSLIDSALAGGNAELAAQLMALSPSFASLTDSAEDLTTAANQAATAVTGVFASIRQSISSVLAATQGDRATINGATGSTAIPTFETLRSSIAKISGAGVSDAAIAAARTSLATATTTASQLQNAASPYRTAASEANRLLAEAQATAAWHVNWRDKDLLPQQADLQDNRDTPEKWRLLDLVGKEIERANATIQQANATAVAQGLVAATNTTVADALDAQKAQAQAAQAAAQAALTKAENAYITSMASWVAGAQVSVKTLEDLRAKTLEYHAAQKELASLMQTSAATLRSAIATTRGEARGTDSAIETRLVSFDRAYTLALSSSGATKAGYADQLSSTLPDLARDAAARFSTQAEWQVLVARITGKASTVAGQLEATAPTNYQAQANELLDSIDAKLRSINATTESAEAVISAAINSGSNRTAEGLKNIILQLQGKGATTAFATGGAFDGGGLVTVPTTAPMALFGEAGPEAIMPLTRGPGGVLGVAAFGPAGGANASTVAVSGADPAERRHREVLAAILRDVGPRQIVDYAQAYTINLSSSDAAKAAYADQGSAPLPALARDAVASVSAQAEWQALLTRITGKASTADGQIEVTAPTDSAEAVIAAAINSGSNRTAEGLKNIILQLQGKGATTAFATGGAFDGGGLFTVPTTAPMALFGEAGPEAIMPLTRGPGGVLGVAAFGPDGGANASTVAGSGADPAERRHREMMAAMRNLEARVQSLEAETKSMRSENNIGNSQIISQATKTARLHEKWDVLGMPAGTTA